MAAAAQVAGQDLHAFRVLTLSLVKPRLRLKGRARALARLCVVAVLIEAMALVMAGPPQLVRPRRLQPLGSPLPRALLQLPRQAL